MTFVVFNHHIRSTQSRWACKL